VETPTVATLIRGTEFNLEVEEGGKTTLTLLDGRVEMTNPFGTLTLSSGEQGVAEPGQPPRRTAVLQTINVVQWALYYPGVLDPGELELTAAEQAGLQESLSAYRAGDLLAALGKYPQGRQPAADAERVFLAAMLLAVGQVQPAEELLTEVRGQRAEVRTPSARLAESLRRLIAAVKLQPSSSAGKFPPPIPLATEWLAESYYRQARSDLDGALDAAQQAAKTSPNFGFAWARVAELEFSFGRIAAANAALERGLAWSPRHAEAVALRGFLLAAQNRIPAAVQTFSQAIASDGALGNAWLGRGLCRIRLGQTAEGLRDLEVAALLEPQRASFRSYLGKAFSQAGDNSRAVKELVLAQGLDGMDPTAWLYLALLNQQRNQINEAIRDLEHSQELNDNRAVYRSRLLLDQDRAVRGANLANIYLDAGLVDVSTREAARAASADYANYSAHLFLANSYNALRDPRQVNLRYETPFLSEYLVANLLAPAGAGTLSPVVTQQEYSKLFERDRIGLASSTEYFSRGDWTQAAAQYGNWRNSAYAVEEVYQFVKGERPNGQLEQLSLNLRLKHEITPQDSVYLQTIYYDADAGDVAQHFSPAMVNTTLHSKERQEPILLAGYHHEWAPGSHTLFLAGRLQDTLQVSNGAQGTLLFDRSFNGDVSDVITTALDQNYRSELEIYTAEAQQIWQQGHHTLIVGGRAQGGEFDTKNIEQNPRFPVPIPLSIDSRQDVSPDFRRYAGYGYYHLRVAEPLLLIGGLSYDWIQFPANYRFGPITDAEGHKDGVSPKAGFVWMPLAGTTLRGAYSRSLGGVSFDQSFQLEPSQVAGFNQSWRSLIPESEAGPTTVPTFETWGLSLEQKFGRGTYLGLSAEQLESHADRALGIFEFLPPIRTASIRQLLDYRERSLVVSVYQLLGDEWSAGLRYRVSQADLKSRFPAFPTGANIIGDFHPTQDLESTLHQLNLFAIYNHPSGFFSQFESVWYSQGNEGYSPGRPGDDFWQFSTYVGYRFLRRQAEVRLGIVNLTDRDYRLNPLNLTAEIPRRRAFTAGMRFIF
jgi:Tfp pilus assembly protein PilF